MDPYPSSKSTSALAPISKVAGITSNTHGDAASAPNEKDTFERDATVNKMTRSASRKMTDRSMLPCLSSSLQELMEEILG